LLNGFSNRETIFMDSVLQPSAPRRCTVDVHAMVRSRYRNATGDRNQINEQSCNEGTKPTQVRFQAVGIWQGVRMPYFNFDLVVGADFKNQGGMILENTDYAIDKADSLASELCIVRPELCSTGCAVRVTDGDNNELYRTPVELVGRG
jgi:hypothetical protein